MTLTDAALRAIMPLCRQPEQWVKPLAEAAREYGIDTPERMGCWLGTCAHESAELNRLVESFDYRPSRLVAIFPRYFDTQRAAAYAGKPSAIANYVYANREGNGDEASGDGWRYRGRGPIQLTFRRMYERAGRALGLDLLNKPELLERPDVGARASAWVWAVEKTLNDVADRAAEDPACHLIVCQRITGARDEKTARSRGLDERARYSNLAIRVLGGGSAGQPWSRVSPGPGASISPS